MSDETEKVYHKLEDSSGIFEKWKYSKKGKTI